VGCARKRRRADRHIKKIHITITERLTMSFADKAKNRLQQLQSQAKQKIGERTGNKQVQVEGKADSAKGNVKDVGEKLTDELG
jgi:uncharacterized protein YjbJ (UPF0337 family)